MGDTVLPAAGQAQDSRSWQVWGIAKQELLYLCWALMEIALLTPVALIFMGWARFWPPGQVALWLLLLMLLPFTLVRFLSALQMARKYQWRVVLVVLLLTLFSTWRLLLFNHLTFLDFSWLADLFTNIGEASSLWARTLILFLLVLLTWWRGLRLVRLHPDLHRAGNRLRAGVLIFVPVALMPHSGGRALGLHAFRPALFPGRSDGRLPDPRRTSRTRTVAASRPASARAGWARYSPPACLLSPPQPCWPRCSAGKRSHFSCSGCPRYAWRSWPQPPWLWAPLSSWRHPYSPSLTFS